ncbi:MAG TPA: NUDIX hydrolase [Vicinamibacterales bacterium]|nr:NUDIX hydrolase [Vicinamibacterales bacterium]
MSRPTGFSVPRPAATVVLLREASPFEMLMVRRHPEMAFMGGAYVFPGGRVDDADRPADDGGVSPAIFSDLSDREEAAHRLAAVREVFEETNVVIAAADLQPFAHWVTPEIEPIRYDTRFFLARMPAGQQPRHDERESTALEWLSPAEAIRRFERRELLLPPPTWTTIRALALHPSIEAVLAWARGRRIVRILPGFLQDADVTMLTLPGDPLMPAIAGWDVPDETRFVLQEGGRWQPLKPPAVR